MKGPTRPAGQRTRPTFPARDATLSLMFPRKSPDPRDPRASSLLVPSSAFDDGDFVLVGLPFDSSIPSRPGARMGPRAFRDALPSLTTFGRNFELAGRICRDLGDIDL